MNPDLVVTGGTVLPMGGAPPIEDGAVVIGGGKITAVGPASAVAVDGARRVIDASGSAVMPGFVNCHTHIGSNMLLRGINEDAQLFEWLESMWQLKRNFDDETLYWASMAGLVEMVRAGITCFNEHFDAYAVNPQIEALAALPLRATLGYGLADRGLYASTAEASWKTIETFAAVVADYEGMYDGRVRVALSPHAPYSCGADMLCAVREAADELKVPVHVHVAEGVQELRYVAEHYGTTPVRWLDMLGFLGDDVTCAHCTRLDERDIEILAASGVRIASCPISNAKLCSGTIPLREVMACGVPVGLATDGPASHNSLDMFQEMKFAGLIHKDRTQDPEFLKTHEILELATTGAAAVMHRPELGRLVPDAPADLIVVDLSGAHALPAYDVTSTLVYASRADDVRYTIVGGEVLLDDRSVVAVDEAEVLENFRRVAYRLRERVGAKLA